MQGRCLALTLALIALVLPAVATAAPLPDCPDVVPTAGVSPGDPAVGHSVRTGEVVEPFDVTVLDVLEDGIAPGRDLIIVEVDVNSPIIQAAAGGIAAGMSGSPIYTPGGELIGALSYGLSFGPTPIAGVTPAQDMVELAGEPSLLSKATPKSPRLDREARSRIAAHAGVSRASVPSQLNRLKVPLSVSGGMLPAHRAALSTLGSQKGSPIVVTGGQRASASLVPTATVAAGDSFAAALSYGDLTLAATGTTTYVCDGEAIAFGHPFLFSGPTVLGASRAKVISIVGDPTFDPYKLAALTDPVGVVDRDRLQGIRGIVGKPIPTIPVTQDTTALDTGATRTGARTDAVATVGSDASLFPFLTVFHAIGNIDSTFNQWTGGSSLVSFTARGKRASGAPWSYTRTNRWKSGFDISFLSVFDLFDLFALQEQRFEKVTFESVDIDVAVERTERRYTFSKALWSRNGGRFRNVRAMRAHPGERIRARVRLKASDGSRSRLVTMRFRVPRGKGGRITVAGGGGFGAFFDDEEGFFFLGGDEGFAGGLTALSRATTGRKRALDHDTGGGQKPPKNFDQLLRQLRRFPRNDMLVGATTFRRNPIRRKLQDKVVVGRDSLKVRLVPRRNKRR